MFGARYFGKCYFGGEYFAAGKNLVGTEQAGYFGGAFFGKAYFGDEMFPGGHQPVIPPVTDSGLLGGGPSDKRYSYTTPHQRHKEELADLANKIAEQEKLKLLSEERLLQEGNDNKKAAKNAIRKAALEREKAALEAKKAQDEINRLLMVRAEMIRRITDEEEALIVLFSLPFIN